MSRIARRLADSLVAARRAQRSAHRARAEQIRAGLSDVVRRARGDGRLHRAWLIGSLARGAFGAESDVDIVVSGVAKDEIGALWGTFVDALGARVDLLRFEDLPEPFRARVVEEGVEIDGS